MVLIWAFGFGAGSGKNEASVLDNDGPTHVARPTHFSETSFGKGSKIRANRLHREVAMRLLLFCLG